MNKIRFYCEKHIPGVYTIFDVQYTKNLITIFEENNLIWEQSDPRSMLIVYGLKTTPRSGPIDGEWYMISNEFWSDFEFTPLTFSEDPTTLESLTIRLKAKVKSTVQPVNFSSIRTEGPDNIELKKLLFNQYTPPKNHKLTEELFPTEMAELELLVRDVECGNWNEIRHMPSGFRLIYDMGSDLTWTGAQIINIVQKAKLENDFHLVISHWDLDHVQSILGMFDDEIKNIVSFTAPSRIPNTNTVDRIFERLLSNGVTPWIVMPPLRQSNSKKIHLVPLFKVGFLTLYRSTDGYRINQSGIVLLIHGPNAPALLTGDHYYPEILRDVIIPNNLVDFEIVVPHHCGSAGTFDVSSWSKLAIRGAIISTLRGRYRNLPISATHNFFSAISNFHCTDCMNTSIVHII
ncbi:MULTISPECIES: hypothetical protein [unclassified Paenibacillus]|uniref:hypothetical protein n=1 Tax=unclassified Paenibacillus TaxID=185978 RepID=UPI000C27BB19|nr:hypothetical protein [Paenibacillus sp. GM1FR]PJN59364.1 hypothetical protein PAEAM_29950 [Paenibacillus sp. GM1FR]